MSEVLIRRGALEDNIKKNTSKGAFASIIGAFYNSKAKKQAKKIVAGIHEAEEIHAGRKQGQSFDDFLSEL